MPEPNDTLAPSASDQGRHTFSPARRSPHRPRWLILGLPIAAILIGTWYLHTATVGTQGVQDAIRAEIGPGMTVSFDVCRAVVPGLIYCSYRLRRSSPAGPKEGGTFWESYFFWSGFDCYRVGHRLSAVS